MPEAQRCAVESPRTLREELMTAHTILLAEDDRAVARMLELGLQHAGFTVLVVRDGASALETARTKQPDAIVLDVMMPKLDGFEVARLLKFDKNQRKTPIVMLTARTQPGDEATALRAGANRYMRKPIAVADLATALRELIAAGEAPK
jgi:DNA-binding response OmpR family regulator